MKTMTCKQLGGACDMAFHANTFEEMAQLSRTHAMDMMTKNDALHMQAMENMKGLINSPQAMQQWMADKSKVFNALANR
jgi:hypothetical protein